MKWDHQGCYSNPSSGPHISLDVDSNTFYRPARLDSMPERMRKDPNEVCNAYINAGNAYKGLLGSVKFEGNIG